MNFKWILDIRTSVYLGLMMALGAVLRVWDMAQSSIWHDEGYTMMLSPMSPAQIVLRTGRDVHPPLYYLTLHYWMLIFGNSETAARGLSAVFLLLAIPVAYLLIRKLWNEPAARLAALFVAAGPFLIRYSQEARMYGMVAFLLLLATYLLVKALETNRWNWWVGYSVVLAAALYTHYYSVFMIVVHWIYVASLSDRHKRRGLWSSKWWGANVLAAALFIPWLPTAYHQFTRVQGSFWIPRATLRTLPSTLLEFFAYGTGPMLSTILLVGGELGLLALIGWVFWRRPARRRSLLLLTCYALLAVVVVWLISFGHRPIFVDRYFVFASVGFYCLLGVLITEMRRWFAVAATIICLGLFGLGIANVHAGANHKMRIIGAYVSNHYHPGDEILSGELYTFFDFSYYNHTVAQTHLWSKAGVDGYGESSLIYDRANQIVVENLDTIDPQSHILWMVGKTGYHQYYDPKIIPKNWVPIGPHVTAGSSAVQEYLVLPPSQLQSTLQ